MSMTRACTAESIFDSDQDAGDGLGRDIATFIYKNNLTQTARPQMIHVRIGGAPGPKDPARDEGLWSIAVPGDLLE